MYHAVWIYALKVLTIKIFKEQNLFTLNNEFQHIVGGNRRLGAFSSTTVFQREVEIQWRNSTLFHCIFSFFVKCIVFEILLRNVRIDIEMLSNRRRNYYELRVIHKFHSHGIERWTSWRKLRFLPRIFFTENHVANIFELVVLKKYENIRNKIEGRASFRI